MEADERRGAASRQPSENAPRAACCCVCSAAHPCATTLGLRPTRPAQHRDTCVWCTIAPSWPIVPSLPVLWSRSQPRTRRRLPPAPYLRLRLGCLNLHGRGGSRAGWRVSLRSSVLALRPTGFFVRSSKLIVMRSMSDAIARVPKQRGFETLANTDTRAIRVQRANPDGAVTAVTGRCNAGASKASKPSQLVNSPLARRSTQAGAAAAAPQLNSGHDVQHTRRRQPASVGHLTR